MGDTAGLGRAELDMLFLRRSFEVARRSMTHGNHPFGAILVDQGGKVLLEAENGYIRRRTARRMPSGCSRPKLAGP